jgi:naphthoate synthase
MTYQTILYEKDDPIGWLTLDRPHDGNMFNARMCHEIRDCINELRRETRTRVPVISGAGDKFCIGGLARVSHDFLLHLYLDSEEHKELGQAFGERRTPDPDKFGH